MCKKVAFFMHVVYTNMNEIFFAGDERVAADSATFWSWTETIVFHAYLSDRWFLHYLFFCVRFVCCVTVLCTKSLSPFHISFPKQ